MSIRLDTPSVYQPARPQMTRLGVTVDELSLLIEEFDIRSSAAAVLGNVAGAATYKGTAQFLRAELRLHQQRHAHGWRQLLHWLGGALVAFITPIVLICVILGMFDLGSVLAR